MIYSHMVMNWRETAALAHFVLFRTNLPVSLTVDIAVDNYSYTTNDAMGSIAVSANSIMISRPSVRRTRCIITPLLRMQEMCLLTNCQFLKEQSSKICAICTSFT
jgi:hypothetical protein